MAPATQVLEQELREATARIRTLESEAAQDHEAADQLVVELKEAGKNPLTDKDAFEQVDEAYKVADGKKQDAAELRERADRLMEHLGHRSSKETKKKSVAAFESAAEAIMGSPEYARLQETGAFTSPNARIDIPGIEIVGRDEFVARVQSRAPLFADTPVDGSPMIPLDQRLYPPIGIPVRPLRLLDMITVGTTESDAVAYVEETTRTDVAAETALGTAYAEADYQYTEKTANVRDIGHWTPAHRSQLADQGQLQTLISGRLEYGVENRLDGQIVNGDGTGVNMTGILETSGIGAINRNGTTNERKIEAIHRGITFVRLHGFIEPDGIGLYAQDYEDVLFEKDSEGDYLLPGVLGGVAGTTPMTIWGKPMVISSAFPQHTVLVGNYKGGAVCWMRSGVSVRATDSHEDFFVKRMIAILAELRAAFAAWQPNYFASVDIS